MAIQADQPGAKEEEEKKGQPIGGAPAPSGGSASAGGIGGAGAPQQKGPSSSGAFTDVGKYVQANQPNIGKFEDATIGKAGQQVDTAKQAFGQDATALENQIQGGTQAIDIQRSGQYNTGDITNASDINQYLTGPTYTGPADASSIDTSGLQQAAGQFDTADSSMGGMQAFLNQTLSGDIDDYSSGEQRLDSIFLNRGGQGARDRLNQAKVDSGQALSDAEARKAGMTQAIQSAQQAGDTNRQSVIDALSSDVNTLMGANERGNYGASSTRMSPAQKRLEAQILGDINQMKADKTFQDWSGGARDFYNTAQQNVRSKGDYTNEGLARQIAKDVMASRMGDTSKGDVFQGLGSGSRANVQGLLEALQGVTDLQSQYSDVQNISNLGDYNEDAAIEDLYNYWKR